MRIFPVSLAEGAGHGGASHMAVVTHADLTGAVAATAQNLNIAAVVAGMAMQMVQMELVKPFKDIADPANNSTLCKVGDAADDDRYMASTELNGNGAYVRQSLGPAANVTPNAFTAADNIVAIFTPPAGKTLLALTEGEVRFWLRIPDARPGRV